MKNLIDNIDGNTLSKAIRELFNNIKSEKSDDKFIDARISTAYFSPSGFSQIFTSLKNFNSTKIMIGSDPITDSELWSRKINETPELFISRRLKEKLEHQNQDLFIERNNLPFTKKSRSSISLLINALRDGNIEIRRYEKSFLHAKSYIFSKLSNDKSDVSDSIFVGSSNLTKSGMISNLELNLKDENQETISNTIQWFDNLWDEAEPFDLASIFEEVFEIKTPFDIFLRVLWELYGDEITDEKDHDGGLPLTSFQQHGVVRALRLIDENGGVIVADEVGLGKTFIAGEILKSYQASRQRALLICPATLRDTSWREFIAEYELALEVVSFEELARDKQLYDEERRPNASANHLLRDINEYQLVIIDEAHNYRNPDSPTRADTLRALLYGQRKDLLMMTATPVNNSLWDLYHLTHYFLKQDSVLADRGILSIKQRFNDAMHTNPQSLSPDVLYPIIDATTVKRTRQFIKKHYPGDQVEINGVMQSIVFPEPKALSINYKINDLMPGLFDLIETYFDPDDPECITFARYKAETYLIEPDADDEGSHNAATGLLLSGLLKRFESSAGAFNISIKRLIDQHLNFIKAMDEGFIVSSNFLRETTGVDDEDFDHILETSEEKDSAELYDTENLKNDIKQDLAKLEEIYSISKEIKIENDPKLEALILELEKIIKQAKDDAATDTQERDNRKVIIFSFFKDTVAWINDFILSQIELNPILSDYKGRIEMVTGSDSKANAALKFSPRTSGNKSHNDEVDILISTDVLAEGVNLQQSRNIINYDLPWNPMRLVQRHGRIDRIGSMHSRIYMRSIFPADRIDDLLGLEERITNKIAMAAASVGVRSPIANAQSRNLDFTETKEEIIALLKEDPSLYERGGTEASIQSGEEYRHTLRKEIEIREKEIIDMPWKSGSGIKKGNQQGIFFLAKVADRNYHVFLHTDKNWKIKKLENPNGDELSDISIPYIEDELGSCLRLIECDKDEPPILKEETIDHAYDLWEIAQDHIFDKWMIETDPANLQPKIRPLNRKVADFIRNNSPQNMENEKVEKALDIIESPWPRRDENLLRKWFSEEEGDKEKSISLIDKVLKSGLEPFIAPEPLHPIEKDDIKLLVWLAVESET
tara:strand:- start:413 stop:3748 length:3336 start_codon:yes stop_codon:yes gene_type:complete